MKARNTVKIVIAALLAILLAALLFFLGRTLLNVISGAHTMNVSGEADPMFASTPEPVTRPPELDEEEEQIRHSTLDDYVSDVETPVDKTAEELIAEAQAKS